MTMLHLATTSSPTRLVSGNLTNWVSHSNSLLPTTDTLQRSLPRQTCTIVKSSPSNTHYNGPFPAKHAQQGNFSVTFTPQLFLPPPNHTQRQNLLPQIQTNKPPRPQHPPLPHGASEHGAPPPRGALPSHRSHRRGILHRLPLLRRDRRTNLLHKLPLRLRQLQPLWLETGDLQNLTNRCRYLVRFVFRQGRFFGGVPHGDAYHTWPIIIIGRRRS